MGISSKFIVSNIEKMNFDFEKIVNLRRRFFRHFRLIFLFVHCLFRLFFQPIVEVLLFHLEKEIRENQALRLDRFQSFHPKYGISHMIWEGVIQ